MFTGSCAVRTAIGKTAGAKSTASRLIGNLMGMQMVPQSSGEFIVSDLVKSTFPLCCDDPTHPSLLHTPLVSESDCVGILIANLGAK